MRHTLEATKRNAILIQIIIIKKTHRKGRETNKQSHNGSFGTLSDVKHTKAPCDLSTLISY